MFQEGSEDQAVIEGERVTLRPLRLSDAGLIRLNAGDERVARVTTSIPHPFPPDAEQVFIARAHARDRKEDIWAMDGTRSGLPELMGVIALRHLGDQQSDVGYWVATAHWNTGIASEAVQALVEVNPQNCRTLFASVFQDNPASARVLTNCGFQYIGDAESFSVSRGATVATWTYTRKM